jgi:hypothetical protein
MNARMLDVTTGIISLLVFIVMLIALPKLVSGAGGQGIAYVLAIAIYIALMSGSGFLIREKIA